MGGGKNLRHKEENTFKFQLFSERIANINIDIYHRIGHEYENSDEENQSSFYQAIEKWDALNLTEHYNKFREEIKAQTLLTLPQVVHFKEHIVSVLLKHLRLKNILCLQALLEFVVALANDLRKHFYEYYQEFLTVLIDLLNTKETEQLEWTFTCLAYIFKFLWRPMIKDINVVFTTLLPLLSDSKPEYINNFAAESFAYVVRKVRDRQNFLALLLRSVQNNRDAIPGCGKLLFEVIHGVNKQFHSCADAMLPFMFESLTDNKLPQSVLFQVLGEVIANSTSNITPQKGDLLWKTLISMLEKQLEVWRTNPAEDVAKNVELILKFVGQGVEHKSGKFLHSPVPVVKIILQSLTCVNFPDAVLLTISQISVLLLVSENIRLPQEQASSLTRTIMKVPDKILLHFVSHAVPYTSFEVFVLPTFLKRCLENNMNADCFHILTKVVMRKAPVCKNGINLETWAKYPLDFSSVQNNNAICELIIKHLELSSIEALMPNVENYFCAVTCLPHLILNDKVTRVKNILEGNLKILFEQVANEKDVTKLKYFLFLLLSTVEAAVHIFSSTEMLSLHNTIAETLFPLATNVDLIASLEIINLYFNSVKKEESVISLEVLMKVHEVLETNFSSPYHEVRLLTTNIYTLFENVPGLAPENAKQAWQVFQLCHAVESVSPQIQTYRDQLKNLELLAFQRQQMELAKDTNFKSIPLRYLCSVLYINFQLLWEPTLDLIATHAEGLDVNDFWAIFFEELKSAVKNVKNQPSLTAQVIDTEYDFLNESYREVYKIERKVDFVNYRSLLWKAMARFPELVEMKNRDVVELLLDYVESEYMKFNSDAAFTWNIKENSTEGSFIDDDDENEDDVAEKTIKSLPKLKGSISLKILQNHLTIFTKMRNPKAMYREPELYQLYFELLSHKNHEIQKLALDCLLTYKPKYLIPYQEHLYSLISENNFKHELATFRVDTESSIIQEEHREQLIAVVLKIVYSKMFAKIGMRTGGKSSGQHRRNLVLRFLGGCQTNEKINFIHMAFRFYTKYFEDDLTVMLEKITQNVDLKNFVPPKRLKSALNLLMIVLDQFGGPMGNEVTAFLLKILFTIGAMMKGVALQAANIHSGYNAILRNLRTSSIKLVEHFFAQFTNYPWRAEEINAVFNVFVWPYLNKLTTEGIHSPTSLLKLIIQWGTLPRYFPLLVKHETDNKDQYVLPHVMALMLNKQSHATVTNAILDMIQNLVRLIPDEQELELKIPVDDLRPIASHILERLKLNKNLNYGSCILLPHVPSILEIIKRKLEVKTKQGLNQRELFILSRISELVWEAEPSNQVLKLVLPIVMKKCRSGEEIVLNFANTISNLLKNVEQPQEHFKQLSPLFGSISYASCRKLLCGMLKTISNRFDDAHLKEIAEIMSGLNAWDAKWVDQPNFESRLDCYKKIEAMIADDSLNLTLGVMIIYNCYYTLCHESDLSLKENAANCWKTVSTHLIQKHQNSTLDVNYILSDILFVLVRKGLNSKNDEVRNESILLLGHLARECGSAHSVLSDLSKLANKVDIEVDFFENLTHLQVHRHHRAFIKFAQIFKQQESIPNPKTLTYFILPLASYYLCNETYASKNSLIDAAIDVVATVSKLLPWQNYEGVLRFYLNKLRHKIEFQRQLIRLMIVVLDSFHFDLSKGNPELSVVENVAETSQIALVADEETKDKDADDLDSEDEIEDLIVEEEEVEELEKSSEKVMAVDRIQVLCPSTASKVIKTIQLVLLPQLHKTLAEMTLHESSHKVNRKKNSFEKEEDDLLRVPISLAVVKLLQQLPKAILEANLPRVFTKLCTFLKSRMESVRRTAREMLQKIMIALGPTYLTMLFDHMSTLLTRGYEIHVLVYTIHSILVYLKEKYQPNDLDKVLKTVLGLCQVDLFGIVADEKEVVKIGSKVSEAKSTKSYNTLKILAEFISDKCFMDLILPLKILLATSQSYKIVFKAQECLRHIALGLVENKFVEMRALFTFAYGTSSESIPQLLMSKEKPVVKETGKLEKEKPDCFIIQPAPTGRIGFRRPGVKTGDTTNAHILVEFGLRLCYYLLKNESIKEEEYKPFVDPFIVIFKNCLSSKHVKLSILTLQCLIRILKYDLPSTKENIAEITESMFKILHQYGAAGLSKGDNFELVVAAFKAMAVVVRDVKYHTIDNDQLKILLLYVEQDMHNYDRQATAFTLLRAIISRKLMTPEIFGVMNKVAELSITSDVDHVRLQARIVFHQFVMDYPLKHKLKKFISFYIAQLNYSVQSGRESAIEMIRTFILTFPMESLEEHSPAFLMALGASLVNDSVVECKKMVAEALKAMFKKLPKNKTDQLFDLVLQWFEDKATHQELAAQLTGLLVVTEKIVFETRLPALLPIILKQLGLSEEHKPGRFVLLKQDLTEEDSEKNRIEDHRIFQILQMLLKICSHCPAFFKQTETVQKLSEHVQTLLGHPHEWVRFAAAQFIGFVLNALDYEKLGNLIVTNETEDTGYLCVDPNNQIKSLTLDLCAQLRPATTKSNMAEQVIKNLVFVGKVLHKVPLVNDATEEKRINILWLTKLLRRAVNFEVIETPSSAVLRTEVFKWIAAVGTFLDLDVLDSILYHLMAPLVREMVTSDEGNAPLRHLSKEIGRMFKKRVGLESYTKMLSNVQQHIDKKRGERKRHRTQLAVTDPEVHAKRKIKLHLKKREAKKRKLSDKKGSGKKRKKYNNVNDGNDDEFM